MDVSPKSDLPDPWREPMENAGMYSLRDLAHRTGIATSTVAGLVYGRRNSDERTIQAVAGALRLPEPTIRKWASVALGEVGPWVPPAESARLDRRTRAAFDELIRAVVAASQSADEPTLSGPSTGSSPVPDLANDDDVEGIRLRDDAPALRPVDTPTDG